MGDGGKGGAAEGGGEGVGGLGEGEAGGVKGSEGAEREGEEGGGTAREGENEEADLWREAGDGREACDEGGVPAVEVQLLGLSGPLLLCTSRPCRVSPVLGLCCLLCCVRASERAPPPRRALFFFLAQAWHNRILRIRSL